MLEKKDKTNSEKRGWLGFLPSNLEKLVLNSFESEKAKFSYPGFPLPEPRTFLPFKEPKLFLIISIIWLGV